MAVWPLTVPMTEPLKGTFSTTVFGPGTLATNRISSPAATACPGARPWAPANVNCEPFAALMAAPLDNSAGAPMAAAISGPCDGSTLVSLQAVM